MAAALSFLAVGYAAPSPQKSGLSLTSAHVYSATFSDGPQPAVETTCVAYKVEASTKWLQVANRFSASAGGEVWAHDSLVFKLAGSLADGETVSLRFSNVTATLAPFMLRISAPTVAPADSLTFKAADDTACPSEHCLVPDVTTNLPGHPYTPTCGFGAVGENIEQPISPDAPAGTPLLVDVTSLMRKGAKALKVSLVPDEEDVNGFWGGKLQLSGAHLVTSAAVPAQAVGAAAGACSASDQTAINAKGGGTGDGSFPKITSDCGKSALSIFSGIDEGKFNTCLTGQVSGVSQGCSDCYYQAAEYGYKNCKIACLASWCSAGCLQCAAGFDTNGCAGFAAPQPTPC